MGKLMKVNYLGGEFFRGNLEYDKRIDNYNDALIVFEFIKLHN